MARKSGSARACPLFEFTPTLLEGEVQRTSVTLPPRATKVEVLVRCTGAPVDGANVRVTLLGWFAPNGTNPDDSSTWFAGPVPWAAAVKHDPRAVRHKQANATGQYTIGIKSRK